MQEMLARWGAAFPIERNFGYLHYVKSIQIPQYKMADPCDTFHSRMSHTAKCAC